MQDTNEISTTIVMIFEPTEPNTSLNTDADRVGVLAADDRVEVGLGEDERGRDQQRRRAADVDRPAHRLRDRRARVRHLLGHVAAGLEAVEQVEAEQAGRQERAEVAAVALGAEPVEEHAEVMLALEEQQPQTPTASAPISSATNPAIATRPSVFVPLRLISRHRIIRPAAMNTVVVRVGVKLEQRADEHHGARGHARHGGDQRPAVDPAGQPGPASPDQPSGPGVDPARDRELRDDLREHERHEQLPESRRSRCSRSSAAHPPRTRARTRCRSRRPATGT